MGEPDMKIDAARASALVSQLQSVNERIAAAARGRSVRLVAVSKLKPANDILGLHESPVQHSHFGENYAQELGQKAALLPTSIRWHFIGGLQSTHCKALAKIPNLWCVSSIDTLKKAQLLDKHRGELRQGRLNVHVQVNTSGEAAKSGCAPGDDTVALCGHIAAECPNLHLLGLMTIGAVARSRATTSSEGEGEGEGVENADFAALRAQAKLVRARLGLERELELSMGMSDDFEGAIAMGSHEVRIGSTIFGVRPAKADAKITV